MGRSRRSRERVLGHLTELRELPLGGGPSDAFRDRLRDELLAARSGACEHPSRGSRPGSSRRGPRSLRRRVRARSLLSQLATLSLAAALMLSAFATYRAVPGDPLYPLKRAAESTLVRLSDDDVERAERELDSAKTRAEEMAELLGSSRENSPGKDALVGKTLKDMEESTRSGITRLERVRPRSPKIRSFARDQRDMVEPMLERMDGDDQDQATGYLDYIEGLAAPPG
ncbi:hypothetical protein HTZ77_19845 [Nonomuraea sp. SMC257]|uniref:DUF5667 domain-containing protein n=1 Tax=Nonomuraea montanisoli TaxID=2741721 RepID=A0A7Y6IB25_9ACTN|nr:DUF5667 domain-containing protein [Nonomuraea montanisoli]NUW33669.1 hypothetical protein [Nonomuraea montanisoli]